MLMHENSTYPMKIWLNLKGKSTGKIITSISYIWLIYLIKKAYYKSVNQYKQ